MTQIFAYQQIIPDLEFLERSILKGCEIGKKYKFQHQKSIFQDIYLLVKLLGHNTYGSLIILQPIELLSLQSSWTEEI